MRACIALLSVSLFVLLYESPSLYAHSVRPLDNGHMVRWYEPVITFHIDPSMHRAPGLLDTRTVVESAGNAWALPHVPRIRFVEGACRSDEDEAGDDWCSSIRYVSTAFPWRVQNGKVPLALCHVTREAATGRIIDTDIRLNGVNFHLIEAERYGEFSAFISPLDWHDYRNTLTHEFGHALGLIEDEVTPNATMFPSSVPGETDKRELDTVDRASIAAVYDPRQPQPDFWERLRFTPHERTIVVIALTTALLSFAYLVITRPRTGAALALLLVLPLLQPSPKVEREAHGLVLSRTTGWVQPGVLLTRARVRTPDGRTITVTRHGGRLGRYIQTVAHQPRADELEPGRRITLPPR